MAKKKGRKQCLWESWVPRLEPGHLAPLPLPTRTVVLCLGVSSRRNRATRTSGRVSHGFSIQPLLAHGAPLA